MRTRRARFVAAVMMMAGGVLVLPGGCAGKRGGTTQPASTEVSFENRLLIIFAEEEKDFRLDEQRRALGPGLKQLEKRGVRVVEVVGVDPLRDLFLVPLTGFHVLLVGRDGQAALRVEDEVVPARRVIEAMELMGMGK